MRARAPNGRAEIVNTIEDYLRDGQVVLLVGPMGVGKTTVIEALRQRALACGVPCAVAPRFQHAADITEALTAAYPAAERAGPQRILRARLRRAAESNRGWLLIDHVGATAGVHLKATIKKLRDVGMGVLLAADTEHPRDRDRVRRLRLTHREIDLPRLHGSSIRSLLLSLLGSTVLPHPVDSDALTALVVAAEGLPGRAVRFVDALRDPCAWSRGRPRAAWLRTEAVIAAAEALRDMHRPL